MPGSRVLHEGNTLALDSVGDDDCRAVHHRSGPFQGVDHGVLVVAVDFLHIPAESTPLIGKGVLTHDVLNIAIILHAVTVNDGCEVAELVVRSRHRCFPDLAFIELSVTQEAIDSVIPSVEARRQTLTDGERETLS